MRHGLSNRRPRSNRGSNNGGGGGGGGSNHNNHNRRPQNGRTQVFDSNGPDVRIRGTAHQVTEKYMLLAKDAASAGDRVLAESYLQHAEHYQRIISTFEAENPAPAPRPAYQPGEGAPEAAVTKTAGQTVDEGELGLPASILGGNPKASDEDESGERTGNSREMSAA